MKTRIKILALAILLGVTGAASAEDDIRYYDSETYYFPQTDNQYQIPGNYQGEYYPQEAEPRTGYYGTQRDSKNNISNDIRHNPDGYYNYYY